MEDLKKQVLGLGLRASGICNDLEDAVYLLDTAQEKPEKAKYIALDCINRAKRNLTELAEKLVNIAWSE